MTQTVEFRVERILFRSWSPLIVPPESNLPRRRDNYRSANNASQNKTEATEPKKSSSAGTIEKNWLPGLMIGSRNGGG